MASMNSSTSSLTMSTTTQSVVELAGKYFIYQFFMAVHLYYQIVVLCIGVIGNTISFIVMLQPHNRNQTICRYLAALAVFDNCVLYCAIHFWCRTGLLGVYITVECQIVDYILSMSSSNSTWIIVSMTADRCIAIVKPLWVSKWRSPEYIKYIFAIMFTLTAFWNIPYFFTAAVKEDDVCYIVTGDESWHTIFSWLVICINSLIPSILLCVMNVLIIKHVKKSKKFSEIGSRDRLFVDKKKKEKDCQMTKTLLLVTFTFLVLSLLLPIRNIIFSFWDWEDDPESYAYAQAIYHISHLSYFSNSAVNFFLYCIGGSRFRQDTIDLFFCRTRKHRKYSKTSNASNTSSQPSSRNVSLVSHNNMTL